MSNNFKKYGSYNLRKKFSNEYFRYDIPFTSKKIEKGEIEGVDYYFISKEDFKELICQRFFKEWIEYNGNYYGLRYKGWMDKLYEKEILFFHILNNFFINLIHKK